MYGRCTLRRIAVSAARERIVDVVRHVALRRERDLELIPALDADEVDERLTPYRTSWRRLTDLIHRRHRLHAT